MTPYELSLEALSLLKNDLGFRIEELEGGRRVYVKADPERGDVHIQSLEKPPGNPPDSMYEICKIDVLHPTEDEPILSLVMCLNEFIRAAMPCVRRG